jgi:hypothetical protein
MQPRNAKVLNSLMQLSLPQTGETERERERRRERRREREGERKKEGGREKE